ncbi:MAG: ATP-binding protein [Actinomycetota bacterium]
MPVRRRLLSLVFSLLVPAVVACAMAVLFAYSHERARSEDNLLRTAQALARSLDQELDSHILQLEALAASPSLQNGDLAAFWQQARRGVRTEGAWVVVLRRDGQQVVNTLKPFGSELPRHGAEHPFTPALEQVFVTRRPVVSRLFIGPVTGEPTLAVAVPVFDDKDQPIFCLAMGLEPGILQRDVMGGGLPPEWIAAATDSARVIVARSPDPGGYVGKKVVPELDQAMRAQRTGLLDAVSHEGIATRVAFARSPRHGWNFAIGVPRTELTAPILRTMLLFVLVALVLLGLGALGAARIGRSLSAAIASLAAAAASLRLGGPPTIAPTGVREVDSVASALAEAGGALVRAKERAEEAQAEAERANRAKSQFLAAASHDLRQPVQSLFLFHDVLVNAGLDGPAGTVVTRMRAALEALKSLLDGLLDISRLHAGAVEVRMEEFAVGDLLDRVAHEAGSAADASLTVVGCSAWVVSDPAQLARILRNLVDNAIKYAGPGARIVLGCRRCGGSLRILVADDGPGIPADKLGTIFEEFVQLGNPERDRAKGLGLGLAIVRHLAGLLGHEVAVSSQPGRGTVFTITVPLARVSIISKVLSA